MHHRSKNKKKSLFSGEKKIPSYTQPMLGNI